MQNVKVKINLGTLTTIGVIAISYLTGKTVGIYKGYQLGKKASDNVCKDICKAMDESSDICDEIHKELDK